jgi:hypothetical protein
MRTRDLDLGVEPPMIALRDGLTVAEPAVLLALDLAERGVTLRVDDAGALRASPRERMTDADVADIRSLRADLAAIVTYCDSPPEAQ